jgi:hypothetical protein
MSYDELQGGNALVIPMKKDCASAGTKSVNQAEKSKVIKVPKEMKPNQKAFENLGFVFREIGSKGLLEAELPTGWTTREIKNWVYLIDDKGRLRAEYLGSICLICRYRVLTLPVNPNDSSSPEIKIVIVDKATDKVICTIGQCNDDDYVKWNELEEEGKRYLEKNYPEYKDITAYWD